MGTRKADILFETHVFVRSTAVASSKVERHVSVSRRDQYRRVWLVISDSFRKTQQDLASRRQTGIICVLRVVSFAIGGSCVKTVQAAALMHTLLSRERFFELFLQLSAKFDGGVCGDCCSHQIQMALLVRNPDFPNLF